MRPELTFNKFIDQLRVAVKNIKRVVINLLLAQRCACNASVETTPLGHAHAPLIEDKTPTLPPGILAKYIMFLFDKVIVYIGQDRFV